MEVKREFEGECLSALSYAGEEWEGYRFTNCLFENCVWESCTLRRCHFVDCRFVGCRVSELTTSRTQMQFSEFTDCSLSGVNWSLLRPESRFADPFRSLKNCRLRYNTFTELELPRTDFRGTDIVRSLFGDCRLSHCDFRGCCLEGTEFFRSDLEKADFRGAEGYQVDVMNCRMKGARFSFPEAMNLLNGLGIEIE